MDFSTKRDAHFYEETAVCSEDALEEFLETGRLKKETLQELFLERQLFPCFFWFGTPVRRSKRIRRADAGTDKSPSVSRNIRGKSL